MVFFFFVLLLPNAHAQIIRQYDHFNLKDDDVLWMNDYACHGSIDSLTQALGKALRSKFYTFELRRTETGYFGELKHYKINCARYGRSYFNTPRIYCEGEWVGKFTVDIEKNYYHVVVYALYYESLAKDAMLRIDKPVKGRYYDVVVNKKRDSFLRNELEHLSLMSLSLKEAFSLNGIAVMGD